MCQAGKEEQKERVRRSEGSHSSEVVLQRRTAHFGGVGEGARWCDPEESANEAVPAALEASGVGQPMSSASSDSTQAVATESTRPVG